MAIAEQRIDENGVFIRLGNGRAFERTASELRLYFIREGSKRRAVEAFLADVQIAFGESLDISKLVFDFDTVTGAPSTFSRQG